MSPPRPTRPGRLASYLAAAFPPAVLVPASVAHFLAVDFGIQALAGVRPLVLTWRAVLGALSVVLFTLILRVQDELKDVETDVRLGKAGDPRYKDRPIVTGHVLPEDLAALWWWVLGGLVVSNVPLGFPLPFAVFAGVLGLIWLSLHWFFWPRVSRSLLLAFATHNPLSLAISSYAAAVALGEPGVGGLLDARVVPLLLGIWLPVAAWETSRKVRLPEDETDYVTYSKVLGWRTAAVLPAAFVAVSAASLAAAARGLELPWAYDAVLAAGAAVPIGASVRLLLAPSRKAADLKPAAELYALVAVAGLAVALGWDRGVAFR